METMQYKSYLTLAKSAQTPRKTLKLANSKNCASPILVPASSLLGPCLLAASKKWPSNELAVNFSKRLKNAAHVSSYVIPSIRVTSY